ncbi:PQQ-binding-like beta-propeller repeat protein [Zavarzinella formosa]|uniref:PQQ-binding-like beta-propeller repeat protein n=1 Tax=Zavarzinella formosa TaxID=360055 RepID=UPI00037A5571|nr:PQQ-binding-like beta-propeller repeat protein [Zavarzinella formosa]
MMRCLTLFGLAALAVGSVTGAEPGRDPSPWPQFRGPGGQGQVDTAIPTEWSESKNVGWKTPLTGKGSSSPVIADGKAWVTSAVPVADGGFSLRVIGVNLLSGKIEHDVELFAVPKLPPLHARNTPASPTPAVIGGRVVVSFGSDGVGCVDASNGKVLWRNDTFKVKYETGPGSSPVPYKNRVILTCDGADSQFVASLDAATGEVAWRTERTAAAKKPANERRAFSTPLVITVDKQDQVVIPGAQCVYSYDPDTGKELWRVTYTGFSNVPRPVFANGLVIVSSGYFAHELIAIRPDGRGDVTASHVAWRYKKGVPNVPSPVVVGGLLFMVSDQGTATCLDAKTGAVKWTERLTGAYTASPLVRGDTIYTFADEGKATLFKAADTYKEVGRNELGGRIQATPAAAGGGLLVRTEGALYLLTDAKPAGKK